MHRVTTGRLMTHISASGDTLMGTVPAGKVWQVLMCCITNRTFLIGNNGVVRFKDAATAAFVHTVGAQPNLAGLAVSNAFRVNLHAGDQVIFHNANAATWDVLVSYFER